MNLKSYIKVRNYLIDLGVQKDKITNESVTTVFEEVSYDITETGDVSRQRVFDIITEYFDLDSKKAKQVTKFIKAGILDGSIKESLHDLIPNLLEQDMEYDDFDSFDSIIGMVYDSEFNIGDIDSENDEYMESQISEVVKARAPRLAGKAEKRRAGKAKIMSYVKKDPEYQSIALKLRAIVKRLIRKHASEAGIKPTQINTTNLKV